MSEETPRPEILSACFVCRVTDEDIAEKRVVVSPTRKAHIGWPEGDTLCGKDATGEKWWWPL